MIPAVEFELGPADDRAFFAHHARHAPHLLVLERRALLAACPVLALLVLAIAYFAPPVASPAFVAATLLLACWRPVSRWSFVLYQTRTGAVHHGPVRLELSEDRMILPGHDGSVAIPVADVLRIDASASHWFVYLEPVAAVVVPRTAPGAEPFVRALGEARARGDAWRSAA